MKENEISYSRLEYARSLQTGEKLVWRFFRQSLSNE
jgi:hypothetical protein